MINQKIKRFMAAFFLSILGCSLPIVDRSIPAVDAGDLTLAMSACEAVPAGGMDVCRIREGTVIDSSWKLIIPKKDNRILGWEVDVYYKDVSHPAHLSGTAPVIEIPWKDFFSPDSTWQKSMSGEALALVQVRWKTPDGIEQVVRFEGNAKLIVLSQGYDRLPIDSGFAASVTTCKISYTTAGRSNVTCK